MGAMTEITTYVLQTLLSLYLLAVLIRFLLQWARADFYNPISQFVVKVTNPLVVPLRRLVPGLGGIDLASLLVAIALQMAGIIIMLLLNGVGLPNPLLITLWAALGVAGMLVNIYFFALLVMIILSWVAPGGSNPAIGLLRQLTEPVMAPFRKLLPAMGGMDFSPIAVFIAINIIQIMLRHSAVAAGLPRGLVIGVY